MHDTLSLLALVTPVFLLMAAGFGLRKARVLNQHADESLLGVIVKLLVPCLAWDVIIGNPVFDHPKNLLLPPIFGFLSIALGLGVCIVGARLFRLGDKNVCRTFAHVAGIQNYGYLALPICQAVFDRDTVGMLFAFNLGVEIAFWTLGIATLTGKTHPQEWLKAINPPIIAIVSALTFNALGAGHWLPAPLHTAIHMLGVCAVPLGLTITGAILADYATVSTLTAGWKTIAAANLLRCGLLPLIILGVAYALPLDSTLKSILVLQAAMPAAVFPLVTARLHGGDMPTALGVVVGTCLLGLVTIPLWLTFGLRWILSQ